MSGAPDRISVALEDAQGSKLAGEQVASVADAISAATSFATQRHDLSDDERAAIKKQLKRGGGEVIWLEPRIGLPDGSRVIVAPSQASEASS